jgi:hypothetical protein
MKIDVYFQMYVIRLRKCITCTMKCIRPYMYCLHSQHNDVNKSCLHVRPNVLYLTRSKPYYGLSGARKSSFWHAGRTSGLKYMYIIFLPLIQPLRWYRCPSFDIRKTEGWVYQDSHTLLVSMTTFLHSDNTRLICWQLEILIHVFPWNRKIKWVNNKHWIILNV